MKSDLELKADILKSMEQFFKGEEAKSWKDVMDKEDEGESEDEEEESCECGKESCPICGKKPKGVMIEETIIAVPKPKK